MPFPLEQRFVTRAEERLGVRLPLSYAAAMCRENGGAVAAGGDVWWLYPIFDDSDRKRLKRTCNDVIRETASAQERAGFPEYAVAIGNNGGGDLLILLRSPGADRFNDAVCWWDHETGEIHRVADDFPDLPRL